MIELEPVSNGSCRIRDLTTEERRPTWGASGKLTAPSLETDDAPLRETIQ